MTLFSRGCRFGLAAGFLCLGASASPAALFSVDVSPTNTPWPGGIIPYAFETNITPSQQAVYLDGLREWELAADIQLVPRSNDAQYLLLKFDPTAGVNRVEGTEPRVMQIDSLSRR